MIRCPVLYPRDGPRPTGLCSDVLTAAQAILQLSTVDTSGVLVSRHCNQTKERALFEAEDIRDWRGHDVVDLTGSKIGSLEAVYFDTATEQPTFATVKVGMVGRHRLVFVPLFEATVSPDHVRVRAEKKLVKDAPSISTDGELAAAAEPGIFAHYGLRYEQGESGERRLGRR